MTVWSFYPTKLEEQIKKIVIKNKGDSADIEEYRQLWVNWISNFQGCETKSQWAISNGIHDAIINQVAFRSKTVDTFVIFNTDYKFYNLIVGPYKFESISPVDIKDIKPNSYVIVSQPNHEGGITPWFEPLKEHCRNTNSKIFLD